MQVLLLGVNSNFVALLQKNAIRPAFSFLRRAGLRREANYSKSAGFSQAAGGMADCTTFLA